jgi:hypothetical protein
LGAGGGERDHWPFGRAFARISAEEYLAGIGSTCNTETCNVAAELWTHYWLLRITGDAALGDRMERIFFNAGPIPVSRDFQLVAYYQTPNCEGERLPGEQPSLNGYEYSQLADGPPMLRRKLEPYHSLLRDAHVDDHR